MTSRAHVFRNVIRIGRNTSAANEHPSETVIVTHPSSSTSLARYPCQAVLFSIANGCLAEQDQLRSNACVAVVRADSLEVSTLVRTCLMSRISPFSMSIAVGSISRHPTRGSNASTMNQISQVGKGVIHPCLIPSKDEAIVGESHLSKNMSETKKK